MEDGISSVVSPFIMLFCMQTIYTVLDSMTENHFFSLSCTLHGHVIATPDYTSGKPWDRGWPQNLYLDPKSPLVASINFPKDFDIAKTPLVTFRQIDILFSKEELIQIHREIQPPATILEDDSLFGEQAVWTVPLPEYLAEFLAPLPTGNYKTMIVNTAGHWTVEAFSKTSPPGIEGVINLFKHAVQRWADEVETHIKASAPVLSWRLGPAAQKASRKRVVVRAYIPVHGECHNARQPTKTVLWNWNNWGEIWQFNDIFDVSYFVIDSYRSPEQLPGPRCIEALVQPKSISGYPLSWY